MSTTTTSSTSTATQCQQQQQSSPPPQPQQQQEEAEARHRKQVKALDGERRAAVKKLKSTKGKKAKEAIAAAESEYDAKLAALKEQHERELQDLIAALQRQAAVNGEAAAAANENGESASKVQVVDSTTEQQPTSEEAPETTASKKQEKARRKRERQRRAERERERQIEEETASAGPSPRAVELELLHAQILPPHLRVAEIAADGHCLYRAVAAQLNRLRDRHSPNDSSSSNSSSTTVMDYQSVRSLCADALRERADEYRPFCELRPGETFEDDYCERRVRRSSEWGGHLEIRALATQLQRPVVVYSVAHGRVTVDPAAEATTADDSAIPQDREPIRLSYHVHYYALGEHYNQVIEATTTTTDHGSGSNTTA